MRPGQAPAAVSRTASPRRPRRVRGLPYPPPRTTGGYAVKRIGAAVSRLAGRRETEPSARGTAAGGELRTEVSDGVRLVHSPYEDPPGEDAGAWRSLRRDASVVTVLVGAVAAGHAELWPALGEVLDSLAEEGVEEVRLALADAAAERTGGRTPLAERIADIWGMRVIAAQGAIAALPDGSLFAYGAGDRRAGWRRFRPQGETEVLGPRDPAPPWQAAYERLPRRLDGGCVVDAVPAGVLVRGAGDMPTGPGHLAYAVPPDGRRPLILIGGARGRLAPAAAVAGALAALPGDVRAATVLAPGAHQDVLPVAQEVADLLGMEVEVLTGLPLTSADDAPGTPHTVTLTDAAGRPTWRPTVGAVRCLPADGTARPQPPRRVRLRSPLAEGRLAGDGTVELSDRWRLALTRSGALLQERSAPPVPAAHRPVDPERFVIDVAWRGAETDPSLLRACELLLNTLHPQLRRYAELRVGGLSGEALRDATRMAVRHGIALTREPLPGQVPMQGQTSAGAGTGTARPTVARPPGALPVRNAPATAVTAVAADGRNTAATPARAGVAAVARPVGVAREVLAALAGGDIDETAAGEGARGPAAGSAPPEQVPGAPAREPGERADEGRSPRAEAGDAGPVVQGPVAGPVLPVRVPGASAMMDGRRERAGDQRPPRGGDEEGFRTPERVPSGTPAPRPLGAVVGPAADTAGPPARAAARPGPVTAPPEADSPARTGRPAPPRAPGSDEEGPGSRKPAGVDADVAAGPDPVPGPAGAELAAGPDSLTGGADAGAVTGGRERQAPDGGGEMPEVPGGGGGVPQSRGAGSSAARGAVRARPAPAVVWGPPTAQDRTAFRQLVGSAWDRHASVITRALVRMPALRGARPDEAVCDLLAVHLYLTAPEDSPFASAHLDAALESGDSRLAPYVVCLTAGLRRLPSYRGAAVRGPGTAVEPAQDGTVRFAAPLAALPLAAAAQRPGAGCVLWSVTARRTRPLLGTAADELLLFPPGTRFDVLDASAAGADASVVLLGERADRPDGVPGSVLAAADQSGETVSDRLRDALSTLPSAPPGTASDWPRHCRGSGRLPQ
ncbi:hypothetical protein [Streptomyces sp. YS415]|uniref:hypothetical protein n=1 Tax=Streptomyces sp. YS415 TaxID=2944806 RepID=UPI0020221334|nr:hypothetical protein [Streptomyces sp. YS415]MCL7429387.1 hypothetical protein [Streptomyces sp. YS415]